MMMNDMVVIMMMISSILRVDLILAALDFW